MFVRSVDPTMSATLVNALLNSLSVIPVAAPIVSATVRLFTALSEPLTPTTPNTAFTEAAFSGYIHQTITTPLIGPVNLSSGDGAGAHQEVDFTADMSITPPGENILGYYVSDSFGTVIYMAEVFPSPIPIVNPGDTISLDVIFPINWRVATGE